MKRFAVFLIVLIGTSLSQARAESVRKVFDGTLRYCRNDADVGREKLIQMRMNQDQSLILQVLRCESAAGGSAGRYIVDHPERASSYVAPNGERVVENYRDFELVAVDQNSKLLAVVPLPELGKDGQEILSLNSRQDFVHPGVDLFVRAVQSYRSEGGVSDQRQVSWGAYRVF